VNLVNDKVPPGHQHFIPTPSPFLSPLSINSGDDDIQTYQLELSQNDVILLPETGASDDWFMGLILVCLIVLFLALRIFENEICDKNM